MRSTGRLCGVEPKTVLAMLKLAGENCERIVGRNVRNVKVQDVQADEIWGYVGKKESHKWPHEAHDNSIGDAYTFVAIESSSKLVLNFALGRRDQQTTNAFIEGLRDAVAPECSSQISTDGFPCYVPAIDATLGHRVDFAQIIKTYAAPSDGERRYSPAEVVDIMRKPIIGNPEQAKICTSHVERSNLSMRMHMRRLTRHRKAMANISITVQMLCGVRHAEDEDLYVSVCPRLGVYSQGETEEEALDAIKSAVVLHLTTAFDHNRLDKVLRKAGFQKMSADVAPATVAQADEFVKIHLVGTFKEVPIEVPLMLLASRSQTDYACAR